ncbi:MAG: dynamin family protein [Firmicutes bacterium]|nr:dynamin family protein [Bacillota bacterium]
MAGDGLGRFAGPKAEMASVLYEIGALARDAGVGPVAEEAAEARRRLDEERLHLAVLGEFKRGKSTLVNALLGEEILPAAVVPLTSVPTEVRHGRERAATVRLLDGSSREIGLEELPRYVTERENPGNRLGVREVEVRHPHPALEDGLVITDTPGLGSVHAHNTRAALDYLPRTDVAVLVLAADQPLSQDELDFVGRVREHVDRLFFVLNKSDYLRPGERAEAVAFIRDVLARHLGAAEVRVFPLSARAALEARLRGDRRALEESGLPELERALERFLRAGKGEEVLASAVRRGLRLVARCEQVIATEKAVLVRPLADMEALVTRLTGLVEDLRRRLREGLLVLEGEFAALRQTLDGDLEAFRAEETRSLQDRLLDLLQAESDRPVGELARLVEEERGRALVADFEVWRLGEEKRLDELIRSLAAAAEARAEDLIEQLDRAVGEAVGVSLPSVAARGSLEQATRLRYMTEDMSVPFLPEPDIVTFSPVLPRRWVLARLRRRLEEAVARDVDRNAGRVRYDLLTRVEEAGRRLRRAVEARFEAAAGVLVEALERARAARLESGPRVERALDTVRTLEARARACRARLEALASRLDGCR